MGGFPSRHRRTLALAAALATLSLAPAAAGSDSAVQRLRAAYLDGRPVDSAISADERAPVQALLTQARLVQDGAPDVAPGQYQAWLRDAARALALDQEQTARADALYLGRLHGALPDPRRPAQPTASLQPARTAALLGGARRVASGFDARPDVGLPAFPTGTAAPSAGVLTAADYARLNAIPRAEPLGAARTSEVPPAAAEPKLARPGPASAPRRPKLPFLVAEGHDKLPAVDVKLSAPTSDDSYQFQGVKAPAEVYTAAFVDGPRVKIIVPRDRVHGWVGSTLQKTGLQDAALRLARRADWLGGWARYVTGLQDSETANYTPEEVAEAERHLPAVIRREVNTVVVNPVRNPKDEYWEKTFHMKGFRAYMTTGADGVTTIYPSPTAKGLEHGDFVTKSLMHEAGHAYSDKRWGYDDKSAASPGWARWKAAAAADNDYVSQYAKASSSEDFAETFAAYFSAKGTPRFEGLRARLPHRFAILDEIK